MKVKADPEDQNVAKNKKLKQRSEEWLNEVPKKIDSEIYIADMPPGEVRRPRV